MATHFSENWGSSLAVTLTSSSSRWSSRRISKVWSWPLRSNRIVSKKKTACVGLWWPWNQSLFHFSNEILCSHLLRWSRVPGCSPFSITWLFFLPRYLFLSSCPFSLIYQILFYIFFLIALLFAQLRVHLVSSFSAVFVYFRHRYLCWMMDCEFGNFV